MAEDRAPTQAAIDKAAELLGKAARAEAARLRKKHGSSGHAVASELETMATRVGGLAERIRQGRTGR